MTQPGNSDSQAIATAWAAWGGRRTSDGLYAERNAVVLAFAHMAGMRGWQVGWSRDPSEPDWPVLIIDTPTGQVSWHFKAEDIPAGMPKYPGEWDGHTDAEKYERLSKLHAGWVWR